MISLVVFEAILISFLVQCGVCEQIEIINE